MGVPNHGEQRALLIIAVNSPTRIKNLMAAVLTISLSKHDELYITWIALETHKIFSQIGHFIIR